MDVRATVAAAPPAPAGGPYMRVETRRVQAGHAVFERPAVGARVWLATFADAADAGRWATDRAGLPWRVLAADALRGGRVRRGLGLRVPPAAPPIPRIVVATRRVRGGWSVAEDRGVGPAWLATFADASDCGRWAIAALTCRGACSGPPAPPTDR